MRRRHLNFYDVVLHWMFRLPRPVVFIKCFFIVCVYCNSFTDDRFVMKQMSKQELQCFLEFAPHYFRYVNKALDEQVCDHVTGCHYKCQAHTWNTYPLTPQPIPFNLQPLAAKFSLLRKEKSWSLLSIFLEVMGIFLEKRHGLTPNLMEMLLNTFLQTFELYHLTFWQEVEGKDWIGSNMRDPSTKDGMCIVGDPGEGPGGAAPLIFWPQWGPKGGKSFFFWDRASPLYLRVWMTGLHRYLKVWIRQWCRGYQTVVPKKFLRRLSTKGGDVQGF